jgi:hypothetical protein
MDCSILATQSQSTALGVRPLLPGQAPAGLRLLSQRLPPGVRVEPGPAAIAEDFEEWIGEKPLPPTPGALTGPWCEPRSPTNFCLHRPARCRPTPRSPAPKGPLVGIAGSRTRCGSAHFRSVGNSPTPPP